MSKRYFKKLSREIDAHGPECSFYREVAGGLGIMAEVSEDAPEGFVNLCSIDIEGTNWPEIAYSIRSDDAKALGLALIEAAAHSEQQIVGIIQTMSMKTFMEGR